jgi:hypothetical protein
MRRALAAISASASLLVLALTVASSAQTPVQTPAETGAAAAPRYLPGLGDLMTTTVQPRHINLEMAVRQ